jgi:hypothetical protein
MDKEEIVAGIERLPLSYRGTTRSIEKKAWICKQVSPGCGRVKGFQGF